MAQRNDAISTDRKMRGAFPIALFTMLLAGMCVEPHARAANQKACGLYLHSYQVREKVAEFNVALRCGSADSEAFPVSEPLVIGLSATTVGEREDDQAEVEYDFPVQNAIVMPDTTELMLTFHAQLSDVSGKTHVYAMAWPRKFLQDCSGGRSGCAKYGYALARPSSLSKQCMVKNESGDTVLSDDFLCQGSRDYRFKFR
jgi:hypothetical protein